MPKDESSELNRRTFIRRAAATTAAAVWAAPVIQTVAATPAFAESQGSPSPGQCFKRVDPAAGKTNGCIETCIGSSGGKHPNDECKTICYGSCNLPEEACASEFCDPRCWSSDEAGSVLFVC
jgi:hypothetical protein